MAVQHPTPSQLLNIACEVGLDLTDADVTSFIELMRPSFGAYNVVDALPDVLPPVRYPRTPGYRPVGRGKLLQHLVRKDDRPRCAGRQTRSMTAWKSSFYSGTCVGRPDDRIAN